MWAKAYVRAILRVAEGRKTEVIQGVAGFRIFPEPGGCYTLPNQARYQTEDNPDDVQFCCRGRIQTALQRNYSGVIIQDGSEKSNGFFLRLLVACQLCVDDFLLRVGGVPRERTRSFVLVTARVKALGVIV